MHTCRLIKTTLEEIATGRKEHVDIWVCEEKDFVDDADALDKLGEHVVQNQYVVR